MATPAPEHGEDRLNQLVELVVELASGDSGARMVPSPASDEIDAVIVGINMLAEELQALTVDLEARELRPSCRCNSTIRAVSVSIVRACDSITARSSSRDGCSDPDTAHDQHTSAARSRTDTPQDRWPRT